MNLYAYVGGNPISLTDLYGLDPVHLHTYALSLSSRSDMTDVQKLALMMDFARNDNDTTCDAINDLTDVLTGGVPTVRASSPYYVVIPLLLQAGSGKTILTVEIRYVISLDHWQLDITEDSLLAL